MTRPQLRAAKIANGVSAGGIGRGLAALDVRGDREESGRRLAGKTELEGDVGGSEAVLDVEDRSRGRNEASTREET